MKLGIYRVWFYVVTEDADGKEVSHTSPVMKMCAAEKQAQLIDSLPEPEPGPKGTRTRNVITQIDQKHKEVLFTWQPSIS